MAITVLTLISANIALAGEGGMKIPSGADLLGPYPILQFFAALIVLVCVALGGLVWVKGKAAADISAPRSNEAAVQLFFDGPLKAIFDFLNEIRTRQAQNASEFRDAVASMLSNQRQQLTHEIDAAKSEVKDEIGKMHEENKEALKDINDLLVRLDERDRNRRTR